MKKKSSVTIGGARRLLTSQFNAGLLTQSINRPEIFQQNVILILMTIFPGTFQQTLWKHILKNRYSDEKSQTFFVEVYIFFRMLRASE